MQGMDEQNNIVKCLLNMKHRRSPFDTGCGLFVAIGVISFRGFLKQDYRITCSQSLANQTHRGNKPRIAVLYLALLSLINREGQGISSLF